MFDLNFRLLIDFYIKRNIIFFHDNLFMKIIVKSHQLSVCFLMIFKNRHLFKHNLQVSYQFYFYKYKN
jgi:hypothetical protein